MYDNFGLFTNKVVGLRYTIIPRNNLCKETTRNKNVDGSLNKKRN